jgi:hypothetical protein
MRKLVTVPLLLCCAVSAFGQGAQVPPLCASGSPEGVPCFDPALGVIVPFGPALPTQKLPPRPAPEPPVAIPQVQAPKFTPPTVTDFSEFWSYRSDGSADYHQGPNVQNLDVTKIESYSGNGAQFEQGYQLGEGIGSLAVALVKAWSARHRKVASERNQSGAVSERNEIRQQIGAYYYAAFDLADEEMRYLNALTTDFNLLARLDPPNRSRYDQAREDVAGMKPYVEGIRPSGEKALAYTRTEPDVRYLMDELAYAEKTYQQVQEFDKDDYVELRFWGGLAGRFESEQMKQSAPAPSATPPNP